MRHCYPWGGECSTRRLHGLGVSVEGPDVSMNSLYELTLETPWQFFKVAAEVLETCSFEKAESIRATLTIDGKGVGCGTLQVDDASYMSPIAIKTHPYHTVDTQDDQPLQQAWHKDLGRCVSYCSWCIQLSRPEVSLTVAERCHVHARILRNYISLQDFRERVPVCTA